MKKVFVMAAALSLMAAPALASSVVYSKHNLASTSGNNIRTTNYSEVCVFCHTPHGGQNVQNAPLWNRSAMPGNFAAADLYNSLTLETSSNPFQTAAVVNEVNASDAKLCISCHDGATLTGDLLNPANSASPAGQPVWFNSVLPATANINDTAKLKNDHPVGIDYAAAYTAENGTDNGLYPLANATNKGVQFFAGKLWCSSCHDVHDDAYSPFLVTSNAASALCVACHNK